MYGWVNRPHRVVRRASWDKEAPSPMPSTHHVLQEGLFIDSFIHSYLSVVLVLGIVLLHRAPPQKSLVSPTLISLLEEKVRGESVTCAFWHLCPMVHLDILCNFVTFHSVHKITNFTVTMLISFLIQTSDFQYIQLEN